MRCSVLHEVLQFVAVCCSVSQCVAACYRMLPCVAMCCSVLQGLKIVYLTRHSRSSPFSHDSSIMLRSRSAPEYSRRDLSSRASFCRSTTRALCSAFLLRAACVCVWEREFVCMCVCVFVCVRVRFCVVAECCRVVAVCCSVL